MNMKTIHVKYGIGKDTSMVIGKGKNRDWDQGCLDN